MSFERSNSSFLNAVSYLYIYIILSLDTSVCDMKRWVLALTVLRGEEQSTSEVSALLQLKDEYNMFAVSVCLLVMKLRSSLGRVQLFYK